MRKYSLLSNILTAIIAISVFSLLTSLTPTPITAETAKITVITPTGVSGSIRGTHTIKTSDLYATGVLPNGTTTSLHFRAIYSTDDSAWYTEATKDLRLELQLLTNWTNERIYVEIYWFDLTTFDDDKGLNGMNYCSDGYWMESSIASPIIDMTHSYEAHVLLPNAYMSGTITTRYGDTTYEKNFDGTIVSVEITLLIGDGSINYQRMLFDRFLVKDNTHVADTTTNLATLNQKIETGFNFHIFTFPSFGVPEVLLSLILPTGIVLLRRYRNT